MYKLKPEPQMRPRRRRGAMISWPWLLWLLWLPHAVAAGHISIAENTLDPQTQYASGEQSNRALAAQTALTRCRQAAKPSAAGICELVMMDSQPITKASTMRAGDEPIPLYLWRFDSPSATVFVAGSMHVLKAALHPLPQQLMDAYRYSDKLVFEVDLDRYPPAQIQAQTLQRAKLENQTLRQTMPEQTYRQLVAAGITYGVPVGRMQTYKPMLVAQQLTMQAATALGYEVEYGVERYLNSLGRHDSDDVLELESLDLQLKLLFNQPLDTQIAVLQQSLDDLETLEQQISEMTQAFVRGDDQAMLASITAQVGDHPLAKAFNDQLLGQRNRGMAKTIADYLETPHRYLVVVGAGHLVGPQSVIAHLQRAGITGQRIYTDQSIHPDQH
jgi:uncharacterized protein YbaP (TraB family)